jgi:hypothetical protein
MVRKLLEPVGDFSNLSLMHRQLRNRRNPINIYLSHTTKTSIQSSPLKAGFLVSFFGVTSSISSIPSRLSTVRRCVHVVISGSFFGGFVFVAFRVRVAGFAVVAFLAGGRRFFA